MCIYGTKLSVAFSPYPQTHSEKNIKSQLQKPKKISKIVATLEDETNH